MPIDFEIQQGLPCGFTNLPNLANATLKTWSQNEPPLDSCTENSTTKVKLLHR